MQQGIVSGTRFQAVLALFGAVLGLVGAVLVEPIVLLLGALAAGFATVFRLSASKSRQKNELEERERHQFAVRA